MWKCSKELKEHKSTAICLELFIRPKIACLSLILNCDFKCSKKVIYNKS